MANVSRQLPVPPVPAADIRDVRKWIAMLEQPLSNWVLAVSVAIADLQGQQDSLAARVAALEAQAQP